MYGVIIANIKGNGETTKCMEKENLYGQMERDMLVN